mmetsp:Transcript_31931/g.63251  ORF Transcript_31931/g.63251 Transcript_31931/m.63251 type:complete len:80 (-) Transcript_31931:9-248(-)
MLSISLGEERVPNETSAFLTQKIKVEKIGATKNPKKITKNQRFFELLNNNRAQLQLASDTPRFFVATFYPLRLSKLRRC